MKFPNAHDGVKKIYTAEILMIIAVVCSIIMLISGIIGAAGASADSAAAAVGGFAGLAIFGVASAVLLIIAFIMNIVGINKAKLDEASFNTALIFVLVGIIASALGAIFKEGSFLQELFTIVNSVASILITYYVIKGIQNLAQQLGDKSMVEKGDNVIKLICVVYAISLVATILGSFVFTSVAGAVVSIIGSVVSIVQYILYMTFLAQAVKMLEA
jgi:hypothetical protein